MNKLYYKVMFFVLFCLVGVLPTYSQTENTVYIAPLSLVEPHPRLRVGYEQKKDKVSFLCDVGLGCGILHPVEKSLQMDASDQSIQTEIRPELRYYFSKDSRSVYLGTELFYSYKNLNYKKPRYYYVSDLTYILKNARANHHKIGLHIKLGYRVDVNDKIVTDLFFGAGLAYRITDYYKIEKFSHHVSIPYPSGTYFSYADEGRMLIPNVALGIRIGIKL